MAKGDRRAAPRSPTALKVEYPEKLDYLADWTTNVSARGFFIATDKPFAIGEELHTRITFPGVEEPEGLDAVVVWRRPAANDEPAGVGVRLANATQQHILTTLAYKALKKSDADSFHIVAVDDERDVLDLYEQVIGMLQERDGPTIRLSTATDGVAALALISRQGADLVIADLRMPLMGGLEMTRRLRAAPATRDIPIIAITAMDWKLTSAEAHEAGIDEVIQKPFRFTELMEMIVFLLASRHITASRRTG